MRVLIADCNEAYLETLQSFLWDRGYEAEIATDGWECLTILREFAPDALVLGDDLPWGGSEGVVSQMSDEPALAEIPVILITANHPQDRFGLLSTPPIVGWLRKPLRLGDLLDQLAVTGRGPRFTELAQEVRTN